MSSESKAVSISLICLITILAGLVFSDMSTRYKCVEMMVAAKYPAADIVSVCRGG